MFFMDIFTMDVTSLAYGRSPVANEHSTEKLKAILAINADASEKLIPSVVGSSELKTGCMTFSASGSKIK